MIDDIPGEINLVDAVFEYRRSLRLSIDTPRLKDAIDMFLAIKKKGVDLGQYKQKSYDSIMVPLNQLYQSIENKDIKLGDVSSKQIISWLDTKKTVANNKKTK